MRTGPLTEYELKAPFVALFWWVVGVATAHFPAAWVASYVGCQQTSED